MNTLEKISQCGIVPVIVVNKVEEAVPTAKALLEGGINVIEITFRTAAAKDAIAAVSKEVPGMLVGAGTVLTLEQMEAAISAGAKFLVSPGMDVELVKAAQIRGVPIIPGAVTPSEIMAGMKLGIKTFKFFPAENYGGVATIKSLCAPFTDITFVPTGGISEKNVSEYLKCERIIAIGGSWMANGDMISGARFDEIREKTRQAIEIFRSARP